MKKFLLSIIGVSAVVLALYLGQSESQSVNAQQPGNLTKLIEDKFTKNVRIISGFEEKYSTIAYVKVQYESPTTILISGDLIQQNSYLWQAMDLLKNQYGFKIQQVMTSEIGRNPTVVYILMTK